MGYSTPTHFTSKGFLLALCLYLCIPQCRRACLMCSSSSTSLHPISCGVPHQMSSWCTRARMLTSGSVQIQYLLESSVAWVYEGGIIQRRGGRATGGGRLRRLCAHTNGFTNGLLAVCATMSIVGSRPGTHAVYAQTCDLCF